LSLKIISAYTGRETGEEIGATFTKVILDRIPGYDITKRKSYIVTDGDPKICKAATLAPTVINRPLRCMDHQLNLCLEHSVEKSKANWTVYYAIAQAKKVAAKVHQSGASNNLLRKEAESLGGNTSINN